MSWLSSTIVATPQTWNWPCPQPLTQPLKSMVFKAFQSYLSFKAHFQAPKSIFENHFRIVPSAQIWILMTFWMSGSDREHISDYLKALEKFWRKKNFDFFSIFFKQFWLSFSLKVKQKWTWKNRKSDFFKNEAFNQKSGTVKLLGYVLTVFHDCGDPPDLKLAMPPASNWAHEKHGFQ